LNAEPRLIRSYAELVKAFVDRRVALNMSQAELDDRAGAADGYCGKIECFDRRLGALTLDLFLSALGLGLLVIEVDQPRPGSRNAAQDRSLTHWRRRHKENPQMLTAAQRRELDEALARRSQLEELRTRLGELTDQAERLAVQLGDAGHPAAREEGLRAVTIFCGIDRRLDDEIRFLSERAAVAQRQAA
jgi:hypothetical protein